MTDPARALAAAVLGLALCATQGAFAAAGEPDYRAERLQFAKRPGYDAYALQLKQYELLDRHRALADDASKSVSEVNEPLGELYRLNPLGIQVNSAIAKRAEGTGLGLPLAVRLAALHGGELLIDSAPGKGTAARVVFPASRTMRALALA